MSSKTKKVFSALIFIIVLTSTVLLIFKDQSLSNILSIIKDVNPFFIIIAFFMMFLFIFCDAIKLNLLLTGFKQQTSLLKTLGYAFVGFYFSSVTPSASGGQPAQVYYMSQDKIHLSYSSLTLLMTTIVYQGATIIYGLGMFVLNYQFINEQIEGIDTLLFISTVINSLVILLMILAMFSQRFIFKLVKVILALLSSLRLIKNKGKVMDKTNQLLAEYGQGAEYIKKHPLLIVQVILVTFFQMTVMYLIPYFVYRSFGLTAHSPLQMIGAQSLISLAVSSLPLPGGMGISENSFLTMFKLFFGTSILVPAMLLSRLASFYVILVISGIITLIVHFCSTRKKPIKKVETTLS